MFIQAPQGPLHGLLWEAVSGTILSIGGAILLFPVRMFVNKVKAVVAEQATALEEIKTELVQQRQNCLTTLSTQGTEQIKLLGEVVKVLNEMHLSQVEMTGFMKGSHHE